MTLFLSGNWPFCAEDHPNFSQASFDDTAWPTMHIPQNWFLGGSNYHGAVWFRLSSITG